jgi:hypothetical protein
MRQGRSREMSLGNARDVTFEVDPSSWTVWRLG